MAGVTAYGLNSLFQFAASEHPEIRWGELRPDRWRADVAASVETKLPALFRQDFGLPGLEQTGVCLLPARRRYGEGLSRAMNVSGSRMRTLHIHPSRMCNLQCGHCRSRSGPLERYRLDSRLLVRAIEDAAILGYNLLSISGGEPLLYPELDQLACAGRAAGMIVSLATNGTLIHDGRLARIRHAVHRVTITVDGPGPLHNDMRGSARAFEMMESNLGVLRELEVDFGIRYSLTPASAPYLRWAAGWAAAHGAAFLQVCPIVTNDAGAAALPGLDLEQVRKEVDALQDIVPVGFPLSLNALERKDAVELISGWQQGKERPLSPLVIEADGVVSPWSYGFPRSFRIGSIRENSLVNLYRFWEVRCGDRFRHITETVLRQLDAEDAPHWVQLPRLLRHAALNAAALIPSRSLGDEPQDACAACSC